MEGLHGVTIGIFSIAILAYAWFVLFARLWRDNFRADIRRMRDELFDYMWRNGHSYRLPAYIETRTALNGILRISHRLSLIPFFVSLHYHKKGLQLGYKAEDYLEDVDDEQLKQKIIDIHHRAGHRMLQYIFLEGTTGVCVRPIRLGQKLLVWFLKWRTERIRRWEENIRRSELWLIADAHTAGKVPAQPDDEKWFTTDSHAGRAAAQAGI